MFVIKNASLKIIMLIRLLGGLNNNISSNKLVTALVKAYCVSVCSMFLSMDYIVYMIIPLYSVKIRLVLHAFQHASQVLVNLFYPGENLPVFLKEIQKLDFTQRIKADAELRLSRSYFIFSFLVRLMTHISFYILHPHPPLLLAIMLYLFDLVQDSSYFARIIMFESVWHRMAMLRKRLEKNLTASRRFEDGEGLVKEKLRTCMQTYKELINVIHQTDAPMKTLTFITIVLIFPKTLNVIYNYIGQNGDYLKNAVELIQIVLELCHLLLQAVLAGMASAELHKMKLCIVKQLLVCRERSLHDAVVDAITYFKEHSFKYTVYRMFTVDTSMALSIIGLLTTYTVAMIQFAHFFD